MITWTVIVKASGGGYHTGLTNNVSTFLKECKTKYHAGYFSQKKMKPPWKVMFTVKGDYKKEITLFGASKFLRLLESYDPIEDGIYQILNL